MATSVAPGGREAPVDPGAAAREASAPAPAAPAAAPAPEPETMEARRERALQLARESGMPGAGKPALTAAEREAEVQRIKQNANAPKPGSEAPAAAAEAPPAGEAPPAEAPPAEAPAGEAPTAGEGEAPTIELEIPVPGRAEPFVMGLFDQDTADVITGLIQRAERGDRARAIRDDATRLRDEADEFRYVVELDPAGVITEAVTDPRDQSHLLRYLLTRPGVLDGNREWLTEAMEDTAPNFQKRGELAELERMRRRDEVKSAVETRRLNRVENREIAATLFQSIESIAPAELSHEGREMLYADILQEIDQARRSSPTRSIDRRTIPGMVQRRFSLLGIKPRGTSAPAPAAPRSVPAASAPAASAPAPVTPVPEKTAAALRQAARARQDAATAPPGEGAQVASAPTPPPYDPNKPGTPVEQRARWARQVLVPAMQRKPVGT